MLKRLNSRGDTLVEVMIAVAILSMVLAASYTLSSHAARLGQSAKERTQAVAYAQQQAEIIQAYANRDWLQLVSILPVQNQPAHFNDAWELQAGSPLEYSADDVAANYKVQTTLIDKECSGVCSTSSPIKQLTFEVTVDWESALPGPVDTNGNAERESTKLVVKVSPTGDNE